MTALYSSREGMMNTNTTPELFRHFPELRERIPWIPLARPTPVQRLERLESFLRAAPIWIKRDDRTSEIYGGDKARKFEFVFGDVIRRGSGRVLAFGRAGSEHCLAVTAFAHHFRLHPVLALRRPHRGPDVQRILEIEHALGADMHHLGGGPRAALRFLRSLLTRQGGRVPAGLPYILWPRRIEVAGAMGYINAAYELQRQIAVGILPEPERIYVPVGSGTTLAGLAVGCRLAGLHSRVIGVLGAHGTRNAGRIASRLVATLHARSSRMRSAIPRVPALELNDRYAGGPSIATSSAQHCIGLLHDLESVDLDPAYGARTMAALVDDLRQQPASGPVLFWHAHPSGVLTRHRAHIALPRELRELFVAR